MTQPLEVYYEDFTAYAATLDKLSKDFAKIRQSLSASGVEADSFGLLQESGEVDEEYAEATRVSLETVDDCVDTFTDTADIIRLLREDYRHRDHESSTYVVNAAKIANLPL
jgi:uncharacterized membrane-anchored protein YhcB (DUF1043 family)